MPLSAHLLFSGNNLFFTITYSLVYGEASVSGSSRPHSFASHLLSEICTSLSGFCVAEDLFSTLSILLSAEGLCFAPRIRQVESPINLNRHLSQFESILRRDAFSREVCLQFLHQPCQHRARAIMRSTVWHGVTSPLWSSFYSELKMEHVQSCAAFLSSTALTLLLPPHSIHTSEHILATEYRLTIVHRRQQLRF